jgi:hypothetical protein
LAQASIAAFKKGTLELQAGCNMEQTLEATVTGELNGIREAAGKVGSGKWIPNAARV